MKKHLVMAGGGHAHLTMLLKLKDYISRGHKVTLISPSAYHYYSGMGPGMLSGMYKPREIRFHVKKMAEDRGAVFVQDEVVVIKPLHRMLILRSGNRITYDVASFNTGSKVANDSLRPGTDNVFTVKPIENLLRARSEIARKLKGGKANLLVVGGGPGGVEVAANLWRFINDMKMNAQITLICGEGLLVSAPERVRTLARKSLEDKKIRLFEPGYLESIEDGIAVVNDEGQIPFDAAFIATGVKPSALFMDSGLETGPDGGLIVNRYLYHPSHQQIFGGGDCVSLQHDPLPKVGVHAVKQNMILYRNILAALEGGQFIEFRPQRCFLLVLNMGDGKGILWRGRFVMDGRFAFILKDYIDRKFMSKFQVSGELQE
jgi:NADH dehydrogenase FAD-containing subunit